MIVGNKWVAIVGVLLMLVIGLLVFYKGPKSMQSEALKRVYISQVVEHPALDATTKGIIDGLERNGFKRGVNLDVRVESAQGSSALASQIAVKFMSQDPAIVVGVGTICAQSFAKYAQEGKVKLVFSSVTDPLGAMLVSSIEKPGNNSTGVSNFVDLEPQLRLFQQIQPTLKRLGVLYNPGEINSATIIKKLEDVCPKMGIELILQTAYKTADVAQAAVKLAQQVDALFISNDNTALSALQSVIRAANVVKIPVYVSDTDAVELGAVAALGPNQYQVGLQTGALIARVLKGENISDIPVEFPDKTDLFINLDAAALNELSIADDIKAQAVQIIQKGAL